MSKRSLVAVVLVACGGLTRVNGPPAPVSCSGGARPIDDVCTCPLGTTSTSAGCEGTPQAGSCTGNAYAFGASCHCLYGNTRDATSTCAPLQCALGALAGADQCYCPDGTQLSTSGSGQCLSCPAGTRLGSDDQCYPMAQNQAPPPPPRHHDHGGGRPVVVVQNSNVQSQTTIENHVTVTRTTVNSALAVARSHAERDQNIPPAQGNDAMAVQQMTVLRREPCHRCIQGGHAFHIFTLAPSMTSSCE